MCILLGLLFNNTSRYSACFSYTVFLCCRILRVSSVYVRSEFLTTVTVKQSFGIWRCLVWYKFADVSEQLIASIGLFSPFTEEEISPVFWYTYTSLYGVSLQKASNIYNSIYGVVVFDERDAFPKTNFLHRNKCKFGGMGSWRGCM